MERIRGLIIVITLVWTVEGQLGSQSGITVSQDGSGNFHNISVAIKAVPNYSKQKYYVRIKAGTYVENVFVGKEKTNLVFLGDGMNMSIIIANRSKGSGWRTFQSATVDINGDGFIAKHITLKNSAGPTNEQAVALKSSSNFSAFYQCRFEGHQDTLYVHKGIQLYRESEIFGTIDLIFGDARVVFQNCAIYVRNPGKGHANVITAQGKERTEDNTGISMHNCTITASTDFNSNSGIKTYLGRPWRPFSTVVIMQSFLGDIIDPEGWLKWDKDTSSLTTLYYGEYQNQGPGANTARRVNWTRHRVMSLPEAKKFTVRNFIIGDTWLHQANITFALDLI